MRDEHGGILEARVWIEEADGLMLVAERFRDESGHVTIVWYVDPEAILAVMWIEPVANGSDASAS